MTILVLSVHMHWRKYKYVYIISILLLAIITFQFIIPAYDGGMHFYITYLFAPLQHARLKLFNATTFSIGDVVYSLLVVYILYLIGKLCYLAFKRTKNKLALKQHASKTAIVLLSVYLLLAIVWNVNYSREKLYKQLPHWELKIESLHAALELHQYLITQFQQYESYSFDSMDERTLNNIIAATYAKEYGDKLPDLYTKQSRFGNLIEAMGIQGYYNPLTGENQYNKGLPHFLHPFIIAHEMAHQLGIAAEGDANLIGYITCTKSAHPYVQYSGYFNLFMYNLNVIRRYNKDTAQKLIAELPHYVQAHYQELISFRKKNNNIISDITIPIYNYFLKSNGQEGVSAYRNLAHYAYIYEIINKGKANLTIRPYN